MKKRGWLFIYVFYDIENFVSYIIKTLREDTHARETKYAEKATALGASVPQAELFLIYGISEDFITIKIWRCTTISDLMINERIRDREVRLIGQDGEQLGIMSSREAMKLAREAELDLVKIAPTAKPPVCKIIDYGKYRYELTRKEKEAKKKQRTMEVKEVRLSPNIDKNDLNTKANQARKFISKGDKVKVTLRFRGREMAHVNYSKQILDSFYEKLEDIAVVDKQPKMEGRSMVMFLSEKRQ